MPLNEPDRAWIRQEIQAAHKRQGWGKLTGFIKDWSGAGAAIAILIFTFTKWEAYVEFRTNTNNRLTSIEKILGDVQGSLAKQSMINHATLPLEDFKATLPDLRSAIAIAQQQKVKVAPTVINGLREKLIAATGGGASPGSAPGYWPTAAEFINYRSQVISNDVESLMRPALPSCVNHAPAPMEATEGTDEKGDYAAKITSAHYEDCRFTLDSPEEAKQIFAWFGERAFVLTFRHCQIVWQGGDIKLLTLPEDDNVSLTHMGYLLQGSKLVQFSGRYLHFQDCLLAFNLTSPPAQEGQRFAEQLLAQNGPTIDFPIQESTHY